MEVIEGNIELILKTAIDNQVFFIAIFALYVMLKILNKEKGKSK